jgi:hypothetical protein
VLLAETRGQALVAAALNDRKNLDEILATAHELDPSDALKRELTAQHQGKARAEVSFARLASEPAYRAR